MNGIISTAHNMYNTAIKISLKKQQIIMRTNYVYGLKTSFPYYKRKDAEKNQQTEKRDIICIGMAIYSTVFITLLIFFLEWIYIFLHGKYHHKFIIL